MEGGVDKVLTSTLSLVLTLTSALTLVLAPTSALTLVLVLASALALVLVLASTSTFALVTLRWLWELALALVALVFECGFGIGI